MNRPPGLLGAVLIVVFKDLLLEWRTRARLNALLFFSIATLLMFSFALGPDTRMLQRNAPGYLWLGLLFASVLSLSESFRVESENGALDGLKLAPINTRAIFLGKSISNALLLWLLSLVVTPIAIGLFDMTIKEGYPRLLLVLFLGSVAISAPGTLYAAISANARARDVLLPLLLFPVLIPGLLSSVRATGLVMEGDPMNQGGSWLGLLLAFIAIYWSLGFVLFPRVVEDD